MAEKDASNESTVSGAAADADAEALADDEALGVGEVPAHAERTIAAAATAARSVARVFINSSSFMFWLRQTTESTTRGVRIASEPMKLVLPRAPPLVSAAWPPDP
jgi:hypothetical protein